MTQPAQITTKAIITTPPGSTTEHIWVDVSLWFAEKDETGAHPSVSVSVPLNVAPDDSVESIDAAARSKAHHLLQSALEALA